MIHPVDCDCELCLHECPECVECFLCGQTSHRFRDEPECEDCGLPHPGYDGALKRMLGDK